MTELTLRIPKGSPITYEEMDSNLLALDSDTPFKVSDGHVTYEGNIGIGVDSNYRPTYNLDFGTGDSLNKASIGTSNADLSIHVDGPNKLKVTTNSQERLTLTTTGNLGINQTNPEFPLDIDGNARITGTFRGNQFRAFSFSDSADLTISQGNILNAKRIVSTEQIDFTQFYDRSTGQKVDHIDSIIVSDSNGFPTTKAVYDADSNLSSALNVQFDSFETNINFQFVSLQTNLETQIDSLDGSLNLQIDNLIADQNNAFDSLEGSINSTLSVFDLDAVLTLGNTSSKSMSVGAISSSGAITAQGDVTAFSDISLKAEINPIVDALDKVCQIGGYTFKRKEDNSRKYTGVIAQEVQKILPEAVHSGEQGLSVAYGNLTGLLIEAVKELTAKVKDLESKVDKE